MWKSIWAEKKTKKMGDEFNYSITNDCCDKRWREGKEIERNEKIFMINIKSISKCECVWKTNLTLWVFSK